MSQAISPSTAQPYGLARVCRVWGIARSTVYWQRRAPSPGARRRGPLGPCTDDDLAAAIRRVLQASPFPGEGYRKVWARLRHSGLRTSPRRVLPLMRAHQLLAPTRQGHPHGPKAHDGTIIRAHVELSDVGDRYDGDVYAPGGSSGHLYHGGSLLGGVCGHPCGQAGDQV